MEFKKVDFKDSVVEFFLGKNVIAKIAIILIFLGIVSFGQLAYVKWLTDPGRVMFIGFIGFIGVIIGYYFEQKKNEVFFNVFYILGVLSIYTSMLLGVFHYEIISIHVLNIGSIILMILMIVYFYEKRSTFFDGFSILFFSFILSFNACLLCGSTHNVTFIEYGLIIGIVGFVYYRYFVIYFEGKNYVKGILFTVITLSLTVQHFALTIAQPNETIIIILLNLLSLFYLFVINILSLKRGKSGYVGLVSIGTVLLAVVISLNSVIVLDNINYLNSSLVVLLIAMILFSIYAMLTRFNIELKNTKYWYFAIATGCLIVYSYIATANYGYHLSFMELNYITIVFVVSMFTLNKLLQKKEMMFGSYALIGVLVLKNVSLFFNKTNILSFTNMSVFVPTFFTIVSLIAWNIVKYNKENELDNYEQIGLHILAMFSIVPIALTVVNELITDDGSILVGTVILVMIGYRYLLQLKLFELNDKETFIAFFDVKILALTFAVNLIYFDHDFTLFGDLLKFAVIFGFNVYIVVSLMNLFRRYKNEIGEEVLFIVLYCVGALIQSFFIHNYINFEIDKVILSSYFMIASAVGVLYGFKNEWMIGRRIALGCIYYSLGKFFIYDFYFQDLTTEFRMVTYFILGFTLLGISFLYNYLEKTYGIKEKVIAIN